MVLSLGFEFLLDVVQVWSPRRNCEMNVESLEGERNAVLGARTSFLTWRCLARESGNGKPLLNLNNCSKVCIHKIYP